MLNTQSEKYRFFPGSWEKTLYNFEIYIIQTIMILSQQKKARHWKLFPNKVILMIIC